MYKWFSYSKNVVSKNATNYEKCKIKMKFSILTPQSSQSHVFIHIFYLGTITVTVTTN